MDKEYILKHKNIPVMSFKLNDDFELSEITEIYDEMRLPFGSKYREKKEAQFKQFSDWIENRGLPRSRSDLVNIEHDLNVKNSIELAFGSYALNLTDHYWAHKSNIDIKWDDVNFFENDFNEVIDFDVLGVYGEKNKVYVAPDLTVDGSLRKKWIISGNIRCLLKGSHYDEMQEPFNEVIASEIMKLFGIEHVEYGLVRNKSNNMPLSVCNCMVDKDTEYITAQFVKDTELKENRNEYDRFIQICEKNGIKNVKEKINDMIIIDYIIGNTDRHTGNFGIIRDADTLEWKKIAPIFDSGNSLCHNTNKIENIENNVNSLCRWFEGGNYAKLDYVNFPAWYSKEKYKNIGELIYNNLSNNEKISEDKKNKLVSIVYLRMNELDIILNNKKNI